MPASVEGQCVLFIARVVAAGTDLAFAVSDFDQEHSRVCRFVPVSEVREVAEGSARVVELMQGGAVIFADSLIVEFHAGIACLIVESRVVSGDQTLGVIGVDMSRTAGPGHFITGDGDQVCMTCVEVCGLAFVFFPFRSRCRCHEVRIIHGICRVGSCFRVEVV